MKTTFEIDRAAQDIFRSSLPLSWLIRKQDPDIHIDYFIEIADSSGPSGTIFCVQLKGTGSAKYFRENIKAKLKTKHLSYYLDKVKEPVFIVVVDVKAKRGYWIFIQEWLRNELKKRNWRKFKEIVIPIPLGNDLSDSKKLSRAVLKAEKYMRDLWPSSIEAAIDHQKSVLEKLDPRIGVSISHDKGRTCYQLEAKEDFKCDLRFKPSKSVQERFSKLVESGNEITFDRNELVGFSGSPLLENVFDKAKDGTLSFKPEPIVEANLILSAIDSKQRTKAAIYGVSGNFYKGRETVHYKGALESGLLKVDFSHAFPPPDKSIPFKLDFRFDVSPWDSLPILTLAYFEKIYQFLKALNKKNKIKIECEIKGNRVFTAYGNADFLFEFMEPTLRHLDFLDKIRRISKRVSINPKYLKNYKFNKAEIENVLLLNQLIISGEHRQNGKNCRFNIRLPLNDNLIKTVKSPGPLEIEPKDQKFTILGKEFSFVPIIYKLTNPTLETDLSEIGKKERQSLDNGIDLAWCGGMDSELIIRIK